MGPGNPFEDPLRLERSAPACACVVFGANGDLTRRKLLPALYRLAHERLLSPGFFLLGTSRTPLTDDAFREKMRGSVAEFLHDPPFGAELWDTLARSLFYVPGDIHDPASFARIGARLTELEPRFSTAGNALFYLAVQPSQYAPIAEGLGAAGLARGAGWRRLVIEKPFGRDLASARELDRRIHAVFSESATFRIDHYLGKETVQNILAFRFGNGIFEPLWNRRYVNHVQITASESIGLEGRGGFYQETGALRDMVQGHLLQVLATIAMEPPAVYEPDAVRDERAKLLRSIRPMKHDEVAENACAGQYGPARIGGQEVPGFRQEPGVAPDSQTDTYAAATFFIDNWRWAGVPFYIRTGKRLPVRATSVAIHFNSAPHTLFASTNSGSSPPLPNLLIMRIQPRQGISLRFFSKQPGAGMKLRPVSMDFNYAGSFGARLAWDYETLLMDALRGDSTHYIRQDAVEASWTALQPILEVWGNQRFDFPNYAAGTWGPEAAARMLARRGHAWRDP
jgi:glucose-6-phosphate 1-dehydrogenase